MQMWEYRQVEITRSIKSKGIHWEYTQWEPQIDLNQWGEKGWELVSIVPTAAFQADYSGWTNQLVFYFKRPKE